MNVDLHVRYHGERHADALRAARAAELAAAVQAPATEGRRPLLARVLRRRVSAEPALRPS